MFPIRDHNPSRRVPVVTFALIAANVVIFLVSLPNFSQPEALHRFFLSWGFVPAFVSEGANLHGLFTSMFLHGGFMHLAGNMLFLWIFGDNLEDRMGHVGFLAFYIASGLFAAGCQYVAAPTSLVPMVGASGAIAGVMGGYLLLYPKARVDVLLILVILIRIITLPAWAMLGLWFGIQLLSGVGTSADTGGVAYWAHAGGFIAGLVLALPVWLKSGGKTHWQSTRGHPPHPEARYTRTHIPTVTRKQKRSPWQ
ncbi:rhomboid family intramembrane serine protease [Actibacterium pelagium]|uniref:Rhomboid family intramembrane serine protease n=1 Tax=Actibacterium pelagium TaxID=2029103 RepID=A0A917ALH2_9RHOB|nr:rhomboid family intramembrane serine protease [Actibacterium pelagium]GGE59888.1 rhomboid family intramembrane serine protease [Actibacterium pelagium]